MTEHQSTPPRHRKRRAGGGIVRWTIIAVVAAVNVAVSAVVLLWVLGRPPQGGAPAPARSGAPAQITQLTQVCPTRDAARRWHVRQTDPVGLAAPFDDDADAVEFRYSTFAFIGADRTPKWVPLSDLGPCKEGSVCTTDLGVWQSASHPGAVKLPAGSKLDRIVSYLVQNEGRRPVTVTYYRRGEDVAATTGSVKDC